MMLMVENMNVVMDCLNVRSEHLLYFLAIEVSLEYWESRPA